MAEVVLTQVTKVFPGPVLAVDDISLEIRDKEFIVLVGPSGCGKSTTLRMVAGLEEITKGEISIGDRVVNDVPPKDRDMAMVFQNYALYPHMTVYKNMAFALKLRKVPRAEIDGGVCFDEGTFKLRLAEQQAPLLAGRAGQDVVLGIRPEAMGLEPQGRFAGADNVVPVQISVIEPLGEKMDLYTTTANHPHIVARVDARRGPEAGQDLSLHVDVQKVHVFEPGDEGVNLSLPQAAEATA